MIEAIYPYVDEHGGPLYEVVRNTGKRFMQRRPDPNGGYFNNMKGIERVPFRLPQLKQAIGEGKTIFVVEGEKDADTLASLGLTATTVSGGAKSDAEAVRRNLPPRLKQFFTGAAQVVVLADNDAPGWVFAQTIAAELTGACTDVRLISPLPGSQEHGDITDWLNAGNSVADLQTLVERATVIAARPSVALLDVAGGTMDQSVPAERVRRPRAADLLTVMDEIGVTLFHEADGTCYADVPMGSHRETWKTNSDHMMRFLHHLGYMRLGQVYTNKQLKDLLLTVDARAMNDSPEIEVHVRIGQHGMCIFLDLADAARSVIEITPQGWRFCTNPPIRFFRPPGMLALPQPVTGGTLSELLPFVNVSDRSWPLLAGWLVGAFRPNGPYAILLLNAVQGAGKSTTARFIRGIIDPNVAPLRSEIRNGRDLMIAASNSWCMAFDNLSYIRFDTSDALCRLSTGGGFATRKLYTDRSEELFFAQRPIIITSIEEVITRADLLDRSIVLALEPVQRYARKTERAMNASYEKARPRILGALLDAAACALAHAERVEIEMQQPPRMADFAIWATAAEPALGIPEGSFMKHYDANQQQTNWLALEASPVFIPLRECVSEKPFEGTAGHLLTLLNGRADDLMRRQKGWPTNPKMLRDHLQRITPNLVGADIHVTFLGKVSKGERRLVVHHHKHSVYKCATCATSATQYQSEAGPLSWRVAS